MTPLETAEPDDQPDQLPQVRGKPAFRFPKDRWRTTGTGYVLFRFHVDADGKRLAGYRSATDSVYLAEAEKDIAEMQFTPGRRSGRPVEAAVQFALIYNPSLAPVESPDAAPRLLEVSAAVVPRLLGLTGHVDDEVVYADVLVDKNGAVTEVRNTPAGRERLLLETAQRWRFAPARRAGEAVEAEKRVPFIIVTAGSRLPAARRIPPKVVSQVKASYPYALRRDGVRGDVEMELVIDTEGRVKEARVKGPANPALAKSALKAVRQWRFSPATENGVPVESPMNQTISFRLYDTMDGGSDPLAATTEEDPAASSEIIPPRPVGDVVPVYPYVLLRDRVAGRAKVAFTVNEFGRAEATKVVEATQPEFGWALQAAVEMKSFQPAYRNNRMFAAGLELSHEFSPAEEGVGMSREELALLRRETGDGAGIVGANRIDERLRPLSRRAPQFPQALAGQTNSGEALVEILIDEKGEVRLPRVVSATAGEFGAAAVQAVLAWRFAPPTAQGKPVVVRVQVPFEFKMDAPPTAVPAK